MSVMTMTDEEIMDYLKNFELYGAFLRSKVERISTKVHEDDDLIKDYLEVLMDLCDIGGWVSKGQTLPPHVMNLARKRIQKLTELTNLLNYVLNGD